MIKARTRAIVHGSLVLVCAALALLAGKDLNWDLLNYHIYAGHTVLDGSVKEGYFPASWQAYLNPYPHVPFYWMVKHNLPPMLIGAALAAFQSLNLILVFEIGVLLNRRSSGRMAWWAVALALFFALANPIFLQELGTSFIEITTGVFVLAGWYGLVRAHDKPSLSLIGLSGLVIGLGIAFKMTNAFFSVTALPLIALMPMTAAWRLRATLAFAIGGLAGVLLGGGWWMWQLWELFGNPLFPMFNNIFHSSDVVPEAFKHYRFIPHSLSEALLLPWTIMTPLINVYTETMAPDIRYFAVLLLPLLFLVKRWRQGRAATLLLPFEHQRALLGLGLGLVLAWALWVPTSANGRYFLPMSMVAALVLASLFARLSEQRRVIVYGVLVLVLAQSVQILLGSDARWAASKWRQQFIELELPATLKDKPSLHLVVNSDSSSYMLPYFAKGSSMMSITGQIGLAPNARTKALMDRYPGRVRVLRGTKPDERIKDSVRVTMNFYLVPFGLRVDEADCQLIRFHRGRTSFTDEAYDHYLSCATQPLDWTPEQWAAYAARKQAVDRVFDQIEDACPRLFSPRRTFSEGDGRGFIRHYVNTDSILVLMPNGTVVHRDQFRGGPPIDIGTLQQLQQSAPTAAKICPTGYPVNFDPMTLLDPARP